MGLPANDEPLDLIWGADAIAKHLGLSRRQAFHMLEKGQLPARKAGGKWVASRRVLQAHFEGDYPQAVGQ
jgi:hypothetical protein